MLRSVPMISMNYIYLIHYSSSQETIITAVFGFLLSSTEAHFDFLDGILNFIIPAGSEFEPSSGPGGCSAGGNSPNHKFGGEEFLLSWRLGCRKYTQAEAERFCRQNNMRWKVKIHHNKLTSGIFADRSV